MYFHQTLRIYKTTGPVRKAYPSVAAEPWLFVVLLFFKMVRHILKNKRTIKSYGSAANPSEHLNSSQFSVGSCCSICSFLCNVL